MATLKKGQIAPLFILIAIAAAVIFYAVSTSPVERERTIGEIFYERNALDTQPGMITAVPANPLRGTHDLSTVRVDYGPIPQTKLLSDQLTIERSGFTDKSADFTTDIDKANVAAVQLTFEVKSKSGEIRALFVTINNTVIFTGILPLGKAIVNVPLDQVRQGANEISISVEPPGAAFYKTSSYVLNNVSLISNTIMPSESVKRQTFTLSQQELDGLITAKYTALARQVSETPKALSLEINGRKIFSDTPSGNTPVAIDLPPALLELTNTVTWTVEPGGTYDIVFGRLATEYSRTRFVPKSYTFALLQEEIDFAKSGRYTCTLAAQAAANATDTLTVQLNSQTLQFRITSGTLSEDVCRYLQASNNYMTIYSNAGITLDSLKLTIIGRV